MASARWTALVVVAALGLPAAPALATTYTVSGTSDPVSASCGASVCSSLRAAVAAANAAPGSTLQLAPATYTLSQGALVLTQNMTITGAGRDATTIHQTAADRVLFANQANATTAISDLTISGGNITGAEPANGVSATPVFGGGILVYGAMTLTDVAVTGNSVTGGAGGGGPSGSAGYGGSASGGAIAAGDDTHAGSITLVSSRVTGNATAGGAGGFSASAAAGGGGRADGVLTDGSITLDHTTVSGNHVTGGAGGTAINPSATAGFGGVAEGTIEGLTITITDSTVADNTVTGGGGGLGATGPKGANGGGAYGGGLIGPNMSVQRSTIASNSAVGGSGGDSGDSTPGQGGSASGGGIAGDGSANITVVNSTITGNAAVAGAPGSGNGAATGSASAFGGGYAGFGGSNNPPTVLETFAAFISTTIAGNHADGHSAGGNVGLEGYSATTFADTIVAGGGGTGLTSASVSNCDVIPDGTIANARVRDLHFNLDDTSPSQCDFSTAELDLVGVAAGLAGLSDNGGPTPTLALQQTSIALGAGGSCKTSDGLSPLAVDQRGMPRPVTGCDIGAFQLQPPAGIGVPQLTGTAAVGQTLGCSQGSWTGDGLTFETQWLRDGTPIDGETTAQYTVAAGDAGHALSCRVAASNVRGSVAQESAAAAVPSSSPSSSTPGGGGATITAARESHRIWVEGKALPHISRAGRHPVGTTFSFTLSAAVPVRLAFRRLVPGRRVGGRCVAPTRRNAAKKRCTRAVLAGTLSPRAHAGVNRVAFAGRLSRSRRLPLGRYRLVLDTVPASGARTLSFRIVRR
jgi:hypothetical protein